MKLREHTLSFNFIEIMHREWIKFHFRIRMPITQKTLWEYNVRLSHSQGMPDLCGIAHTFWCEHEMCLVDRFIYMCGSFFLDMQSTPEPKIDETYTARCQIIGRTHSKWYVSGMTTHRIFVCHFSWWFGLNNFYSLTLDVRVEKKITSTVRLQ